MRSKVAAALLVEPALPAGRLGLQTRVGRSALVWCDAVYVMFQSPRHDRRMTDLGPQTGVLSDNGARCPSSCGVCISRAGYLRAYRRGDRYRGGRVPALPYQLEQYNRLALRRRVSVSVSGYCFWPAALLCDMSGEGIDSTHNLFFPLPNSERWRNPVMLDWSKLDSVLYGLELILRCKLHIGQSRAPKHDRPVCHWRTGPLVALSRKSIGPTTVGQ